MHTQANMHAYTHIHTHKYIFMHSHASTHRHAHASMRTHTCTHAHTGTRLPALLFGCVCPSNNKNTHAADSALSKLSFVIF